MNFTLATLNCLYWLLEEAGMTNLDRVIYTWSGKSHLALEKDRKIYANLEELWDSKTPLCCMA